MLCDDILSHRRGDVILSQNIAWHFLYSGNIYSQSITFRHHGNKFTINYITRHLIKSYHIQLHHVTFHDISWHFISITSLTFAHILLQFTPWHVIKCHIMSWQGVNSDKMWANFRDCTKMLNETSWLYNTHDSHKKPKKLEHLCGSLRVHKWSSIFDFVWESWGLYIEAKQWHNIMVTDCNRLWTNNKSVGVTS